MPYPKDGVSLKTHPKTALVHGWSSGGLHSRHTPPLDLVHKRSFPTMTSTATRWLLLAFVLLVLPVADSAGQGTTASITGTVEAEEGEALPGVNVVAVHQPTGTQYGVATNANGRYTIQGMRVGGPYTVTASFVGYQSTRREGIQLQLDQTREVNFQLRQKTEEMDELEVVAERTGAVIDKDRTGAATNVSARQIEELPAISRSITDFTRLVPQAQGDGSIGGANSRYNSIQVDGATLDDVFGLGDAVPGSQAGAEPISLDAIEEFNINIAPYDVRGKAARSARPRWSKPTSTATTRHPGST